MTDGLNKKDIKIEELNENDNEQLDFKVWEEKEEYKNAMFQMEYENEIEK